MALRASIVVMLVTLKALASTPDQSSNDGEPLRSDLLRRPLDERCQLSQLVAERVVTAYDWAKQLPIHAGAVSFAVLLPGDVPLLAEGEACELTLLTRQTNGPVRVVFDPSKLKSGDLFVDWVPSSLPGPLRFRRSASLGAPQPNIPRFARVRSGRTVLLADIESPDLELELTKGSGGWAVATRLVFKTRSVPLAFRADGGR